MIASPSPGSAPRRRLRRVYRLAAPGGFLGAILLFGMCLSAYEAAAEAWPSRGRLDSRIRTAVYSDDQVYRLLGHVGYQIDLQFEAGEYFIGLGAGDLEGLSFSAQDNHLFLKPGATQVRTNLTVLTNRRHYQFDYVAGSRPPDPAREEVTYVLRFAYPSAIGEDSSGRPANRPSGGVPREAGDTDAKLRNSVRAVNLDYWYCGHPALRPDAASDDGIHTRLRFGARSEQPAIFVRNDDGTESLLNFSMDASDVILHRVVRRLIVRRGKLAGCIVNKRFGGTSERLQSGTVAAEVTRSTRSARP
ncbi:hypothetical protein ACG33_09855 [Steroidobacter denitrificans]|uniref:Conjugal transfer protein TrbG n=1 Tax=Steroidobacter denitrificans TaxID=465721 RepID=A0A127FAF4_STEDE|nr:TrbG/VirB9 family P-type conjugative transfer protein [Steroidobacter denitrificans]AMN47396.1 hypothetical protein ACG33_09855 [Steroidobacter denitrificans]